MFTYPKLQFLVVTIAVISLSLLYFFYPAANGSFHPDCPFHTFTGLYCPGCGSQRAASALLHGNLLKAASLNVLFVTSLPLLAFSAFVFTWNTFSERKISQPLFYSPLFVKIIFVIVVLFGILRNLPYRPFNWLAP